MDRRAALIALALAAGCSGDDAPRRIECPAVNPQAVVSADGVYRYSSYDFALRGTITFAQAPGERAVSVIDTTYDNAVDRALKGAGTLQGNRLDILLVPKNGDTNYSAQVGFVFAEGGAGFCLLGFSDTNGDKGGPGSYLGTLVLVGYR
jgi:hypothetical protein